MRESISVALSHPVDSTLLPERQPQETNAGGKAGTEEPALSVPGESGSGVPGPAQSCLLSAWEEPLTQNKGPVGGVDTGLSQPVDIKPHEMLELLA